MSVVTSSTMSRNSFKMPSFVSPAHSYDALGPQYSASLNPFEIQWIFGFNSSVPVINFETNINEIFYVANNTGVFFNLHTKRMSFLNVHLQSIVSTATDASGRWFATAGSGIGNVINIWDTTDKSLVAKISNFVPDNSSFIRIGISPSAKFLVVVHNSNKTTFINIWLWTYGCENSNATFLIDTETGIVRSIEFHPNHENHLMIAFEKCTVFLYWDAVKSVLVHPTVAKNPNFSEFGLYTDGTFVENCNECFIATTAGYLLTFGRFYYDREELHLIDDNEKILISTVKISDVPVTCLTTIGEYVSELKKSTLFDEMVVIGDSIGHIKFFDKSLTLLHCFKKSTFPIKSISFKALSHDRNSSQKNDSKETSILGVDFIFATTTGIFHVKFLENICTELSETYEAPVAAIDVHSKSPFLVVGFSNGQIALYNYETYEKIATHKFTENDQNSNEIITVTTLKYSPNSVHLACGRSNGELWFLQPIDLSLIYDEPFQCTSREIRKITFSFNDHQLAYYDDYMTVYGMMYQSENWHYCGKVRSHYKNIKHILFTNEESFNLYTIGIDRYLIEYDDFEICSEFDELKIRNRYRIEQRDIPLYFIQHPLGAPYFLVCDNQCKYKVINATNSMCMSVNLGPAYGHFKNQPVIKIEYLVKSDLKYLIFMNRNYIGIQKCPIDGNPYKFIANLGHPDEITDFRVSNDGRFVFIIGRNDPTVKMLKIETKSVEILHQLGGDGLQPYYCLLDDGKNGYFFQELQDLFYYIQILQQSKENHLPRHISDYINIVELPDLVRACGYYPTEFEVENLLTDIRYRNYNETGQINEQVCFNEFVKLLINHRPPYGYNYDDLRKSFEIVANEDEDSVDFGGMIKEKFVVALTTLGESFSKENLISCLYTLSRHDESVVLKNYGLNQDEIPLPSVIDFQTFSNEILGVVDVDINDDDLKFSNPNEQNSDELSTGSLQN